MSSTIEKLYLALQERDVTSLYVLLHPDFEGHVAPGMPCGVGGAHHGRDAMILKVWGEVVGHFDTAPYPETSQQTADGTVVVTGHYRGTVRATGCDYDAEFTHLWRLSCGQVVWLHQYTDTAKWHEALEAA